MDGWKGRTVNPIQAKPIDQLACRSYKRVRPGPAAGDKREVVAALAAAAHGEDHAQLRVLPFELDERTETAGCAIDGHLGVSPFVAQLGTVTTDLDT
jgi:hypothetical protein